MKGRRKKLTALFLCMALTAALTACAGKDEGAAYSGEPAVQSEADAETSYSEISETGSRQEPSVSGEGGTHESTEEDGVDLGDRAGGEADTDSNILIAYFTWAENTHVENPEAVDVDATTSASVLLPGNTAKMANWIRERVGGDLFSIVVTEPYSDDYDECLDRAADEKAENARPELVNHVENMREYDVIFLGFPNWWYTAPMAIFSFIEEYDFSGKTIIPFCAHGTGGLAGSVKDITAALPDSAEVLEPIGVYRPDVDSAQPAINDWLDRLGYTEEKQAESGMENDVTATMKAEVESKAKTTEMKVKITVGDTELTAVMEDNATTQALIEQMPMTLPMMDLYGREMCYRYGAYALPTDNLQSDGYEVGDLAYWAPGGSLVILYKQNGEQFERQHLGHIESGVEVFEDTGDVDVTFELMEPIQ